MGDSTNKNTQNRFAQRVIEENVAGEHHDVATAMPVPRKQTPIAMPAPPSRESHDDLDSVLEMQKLERERAELLVKQQDSEQENERLRLENERLRTKIEPVHSFPPPPIVSKPPQSPIAVESAPVDMAALHKAVLSSKAGRSAIVIGILLNLMWNAFNMARQAIPEQKAAAASAKADQNSQVTQAAIEQRLIEQQRTLQALRALQCWGKQTRGGFERQGLVLSSLPPGGIKALKLGDEDPNRPGPPKFYAEEKCPDFPQLPPETGR